MTILFKEFRSYLYEARGLLKGSGKEAEYHKKKYLDPFVGSEEPTHEIATAHQGLTAGSKVRIHSVYKGNDDKNYAVVSGEDKKEVNIPVSKLHKPGVEPENKGLNYEKQFFNHAKSHGIVPEGLESAGSTAGTDISVINKNKNTLHKGQIMGEDKVFHGEVKQDVTAAMGQLTIRHSKEKGWHIPDDARAKRPRYAAEIEKAGILEHMNKNVPDPDTDATTASGRAKNRTIVHPNLNPADAYLQDHHAHFVQIGSGFGTYKVGEKDATGHGFPGLSGEGLWTVRQKQIGNNTSRTVMFQPNGKKGLNRSHINLDNNEDMIKFKRTLGHLEMEKARKEFHAATKTPKPKEPETGTHIIIHSGGSNKKVKLS